MQTSDPRLKNLRPFRKGQSGNPKGREKGVPTMKTILDKILDGMITVEEAGKLKKISRREAIAFQLYKDALDNRNTAGERTRAAVAIMDREEGKPVQPHSEIIGPEITLVMSPAEAEL